MGGFTNGASGASIGVSLLILGVAAWRAFHTPPTNRAGTTFFMFCLGLAFYFVLLVVLWLVGYAMLVAGGLRPLGLKENATVAPLVPVVSALLLLLGARALPRVPEWDRKARKICLGLASIPLERDRLAHELADLTPFEVTQAALDRTVAPELARRGIPPAAGRLDAGEGLAAAAAFAFQRAVLLRLRLGVAVAARMSASADPDPLTPAYRARLAGLAEERERARAQYDALMAFAARYFASPAFQDEKAGELRAVADGVFACYARLLAMVVLACERTEGARRRKLAEFGFGRLRRASGLTHNHFVAVLLLVVAVLGVSQLVVLPVGVGRPVEGPFAAVMVGMEFALAVLLGAQVAHRAVLRLGDGPPRGFVWPPLAAAVVAGLGAVAASIVLRVLFRCAASMAADGLGVGIGAAQAAAAAVATVLAHDWPYTLFALTTTATTALCCFWLGRRGVRPRALILPGGAVFAAALAGTAVLVAGLMPDGPSPLGLAAVAAPLGFCLGACVPSVFRMTLGGAEDAGPGAKAGAPLAGPGGVRLGRTVGAE